MGDFCKNRAAWKTSCVDCDMNNAMEVLLAYLETRFNNKIDIAGCQKGISIAVTAI